MHHDPTIASPRARLTRVAPRWCLVVFRWYHWMTMQIVYQQPANVLEERPYLTWDTQLPHNHPPSPRREPLYKHHLAKMLILFLCTAHNSLSQRLFLELSKKHHVTIEYALSYSAMVEAAAMVEPDLIVCPFLTTRVPHQVYNRYLTLIVHPGPPGDAGPSAIDWLLMGDDGSEPDSEKLLCREAFNPLGRTHWGVSVLQAVQELDAGPIWAFEQFEVNINEPELTKSSLYRGPITQAAVVATTAAILRIEATANTDSAEHPPGHNRPDATFYKSLAASQSFGHLSVSSAQPFQGGPTQWRPLLPASQRAFDPTRHDAAEISRRIRSGDSQPGCLSAVFGPKLYLYGGVVEDAPVLTLDADAGSPGTVIDTRNEAVCIATCDGKGVWITHVRQVKTKAQAFLWPKVPAVSGLAGLGCTTLSSRQQRPTPVTSPWVKLPHSTHQDIWVNFANEASVGLVAYVHFDFYNGAMSTGQCKRLVEALDFVLSHAQADRDSTGLAALVLMGGSSYFSNGIHLNVIEAATDPALESWYNINAINDVVEYILDKFPRRRVTTIAAVRGNCAAGGVALATACDVVLAGERVVLNPAYRALGLHGSEYYSITYSARCGARGAAVALRSMTPLSAADASQLGIVDHVLSGTGSALDAAIRSRIQALLSVASNGHVTSWKQNVDLSPSALARARAEELGQMAVDFWSPRSQRYHSRRHDFVRKVKPSSTPLRFATHRRTRPGMADEEESEDFDSVQAFDQTARRGVVMDFMLKMTTQMGSRDNKKGHLGADIAQQELFPCYYAPIS